MFDRFYRISLQKLSSDLDEAIDFLENNLKVNSPLFLKVILLKSRKNALTKRQNQGVLTDNQYNLEYNKLTASLLYQVENLNQNNTEFKRHDIYCRLVLPNNEIKDYPTFYKDEIVVGRAADADIILETSNISRKHCKIHTTPSVFRVNDLGSTNGSYINGLRITNAVIGLGDKLEIGDYVIKIVDRFKNNRVGDFRNC